MKPLTPKQNRFVAEYLVDLNATQAAVRAGYAPRSAHVTGSQALTIPKVKEAIDAALQRRAARVEVKQDDVLRELLRIALADIGQAFDAEGKLKAIHDMPEDVRRAISAVEVEELFEGNGAERVQVGHTRKVKFWDKTKTLRDLGEHLKLFTQKHEHELGAETLDRLLERAGVK